MSLTQERDGRHHLAGRAKAALESIVIDKSLLDRMEFAILGETLDGCYFPSCYGGREHHAAIHAPFI
jgi:hypothetical protein